MNTRIENISEYMTTIMEDLRNIPQLLEYLELCDCDGHCDQSIARMEVPAAVATIAVDLENMMRYILDPGDFDFLTERVNTQSG